MVHGKISQQNSLYRDFPPKIERNTFKNAKIYRQKLQFLNLFSANGVACIIVTQYEIKYLMTQYCHDAGISPLSHSPDTL